MPKFRKVLWSGLALSGAAALFVATGALAGPTGSVTTQAALSVSRVQKVQERLPAVSGGLTVSGATTQVDATRSDYVDRTEPRPALIALAW